MHNRGGKEMSDLQRSSQEEALVDIVESIVSKQNSVGYFINAEVEKIQSFSDQSDTSLDEIIDFHTEVASNIKNTMKLQMLLQFKLEEILEKKNWISQKAGETKAKKSKVLIDLLEAVIFVESVIENFLQIELKVRKKVVQKYNFLPNKVNDFMRIMDLIINNGKRIQKELEFEIKMLENYL